MPLSRAAYCANLNKTFNLKVPYVVAFMINDREQ